MSEFHFLSGTEVQGFFLVEHRKLRANWMKSFKSYISNLRFLLIVDAVVLVSL